jgi:trimeric autotransporter adhesin
MAIRLRESDNDPYVYIEPITSGSVAMGTDASDNNKLKVVMSSAIGDLDPSSGTIAAGSCSLSIDPSTNGNIEFCPQGSGQTNFARGSIAIEGQSSTAGNLLMNDTTTGGGAGVIEFGSNRFIHNYGVNNTFVGELSGNTNSGIGAGNTAMGTNALTSVTTGVNNVAVGFDALQSLTTESGAVAVGYQALNSMTTSTFGNGLVAVGYKALKSSVTDMYNTAVGFQALTVLNGGQYNTAIGDSALEASTSDSNNTAVGWGTLSVLNGGSANTAIGTGVGVHMTTGSDNTGCGEAALNSLTSGIENTVVGSNALYNGLTASNNIVIGYEAASAYVAAESSNIIIGNTGVVSESNQIRIGTQGSSNGQQNACNIAGIYNSSVTAAGTVVIDSSGNLGSINGVTPSVWNDVTGASATMAPNNGYVADRSSLVTLTLPATAAFGSRLEIVGKGAGGWTIAQNAGQTIHFNSTSTTTGASGSLSSTQQYNCVELICVTANTDFVVKDSSGNLTVV